MRPVLSLLFLLLAQPSFAASSPDARYEQDILDTIKDIENLSHDEALNNTRDLIKKYPTSRLGQMIYADLLMAKVGPLDNIGSGIPEERKVRDFQYELRQRWEHNTDITYRARYPQNIIAIGDNQPYVILVDLASLRIYVYRNEQGKPVLESDYFISIGLKGYAKEKRGDQKTPVGVYHVTSYIDGSELPDLYGRGAFPVNYPNVWDQLRKRTGSGIWIHGTPSGTYNRAPWASDGCIVISNPGLADIAQYISAEMNTPVVVAEQVEWLTREQWQKQREELLHVFSGWISDRESLDYERYTSTYSRNEFFTNTPNSDQWEKYIRRINRDKIRINVGYSDLTIFRYPGEKNLILMQYNQSSESKDFNLKSPREIYWQEHSTVWRIVYEGARKFPREDPEITAN